MFFVPPTVTSVSAFSFLLLSVVAADTTDPAAVIRSSCSATLYPDLCISAVAAAPELAASVKTPRDVIELSIKITLTAVQHNYFTVKRLAAGEGLTARERTALHDCLDVIEETLDELREAAEDLEEYPSFERSVARHADDLVTLLSAAMTNQDTCVDGFSHARADRRVRKALLSGQVHVFRMCSNVLAMIMNLTSTDIANNNKTTDNKITDNMANNLGVPETPAWPKWLSGRDRRLLQAEGVPAGTTTTTDIPNNLGITDNVANNLGVSETPALDWPEWMSGRDRRLLQAAEVAADVTVAADGSGDFMTVGAAVAAAPEGSMRKYVIRIRAGVYREKVEVTKRKINLMFVGDGRKTTIITGSLNVVDGSTTFNSATVAVVGDGFLAKEITFQNTAGPAKHQAVALRVGSDLSAFYKCDMIAYQDTLYVHSLRQFYINCYVAGTVDFIFGNAAAVFQDCDIHARLPGPGQRNMVTAQGRDDPNQNTGIVIQKCRVGSTSDLLAAGGRVETYLGRPWKPYSRTVVMQSAISDIIAPSGWYPWPAMTWFSTVYYGEYQNSGAGSGTAGRVTWAGVKVIGTAAEAQRFTAGSFVGGANWLGSTGFPYSLGL